MAAFLDDQPLDPTGDSLGDLLAEARARLTDGGRIVVEVLIDGEAVLGDDLDRRLAEPLGDAEVRLISASPTDVAADALRAVRDRLGEARVLQDEAADLLQRDQAGEGLRKVTLALDAWLSTPDTVLHAADLLGVDLEAFAAGDQALTDAVEELVASLGEVRGALEAGDTIALADTLAYQWPAITDRWDALLGGLLDRAAG